jgi:hypothetical protein
MIQMGVILFARRTSEQTDDQPYQLAGSRLHYVRVAIRASTERVQFDHPGDPPGGHGGEKITQLKQPQ